MLALQRFWWSWSFHDCNRTWKCQLRGGGEGQSKAKQTGDNYEGQSKAKQSKAKGDNYEGQSKAKQNKGDNYDEGQSKAKQNKAKPSNKWGQL
jgi:hypothetical protein